MVRQAGAEGRAGHWAAAQLFGSTALRRRLARACGWHSRSGRGGRRSLANVRVQKPHARLYPHRRGPFSVAKGATRHRVLAADTRRQFKRTDNVITYAMDTQREEIQMEMRAHDVPGGRVLDLARCWCALHGAARRGGQRHAWLADHPVTRVARRRGRRPGALRAAGALEEEGCGASLATTTTTTITTTTTTATWKKKGMWCISSYCCCCCYYYHHHHHYDCYLEEEGCGASLARRGRRRRRPSGRRAAAGSAAARPAALMRRGTCLGVGVGWARAGVGAG